MSNKTKELIGNVAGVAVLAVGLGLAVLAGRKWR